MGSILLEYKMNGHGGRRKGAGREPNLTREQEFDLWLYLHKIRAWAWKRNRKKWKIANENSKRNSELARSYERIKQVQIAHRPLLAAAGELEKIDKSSHAERPLISCLVEPLQ